MSRAAMPKKEPNVWGDLTIRKGDKCVRCGCNKLALLHRMHGLPYLPEGSDYVEGIPQIVACSPCWLVLKQRINQMAKKFWLKKVK